MEIFGDNQLYFSKILAIKIRSRWHRLPGYIFVDIVQTGGGEVNSISKKNYKFIFWQKEEREGVINEFLGDFYPKICAYKVM